MLATSILLASLAAAVAAAQSSVPVSAQERGTSPAPAPAPAPALAPGLAPGLAPREAISPTPQRVGNPLPIQTPAGGSTEQDEKATQARRDHRELDRTRLGPDGNRDRILNRRRLEAVDAMVEDQSPLDASLRSMQTDLSAMPSNFLRVYVDPADPEQYVRANGALFAVFPYSQYRKAKNGKVPMVPSSTVFRIGMPAHFVMDPIGDPFALAAPERVHGLMSEDRGGDVRIDRRIDRYMRSDFSGGGSGGGVREEGLAAGLHAGNQSRGESSRQRQESVERVAERTMESALAPQERETPLPPIIADEAYRRQFFERLRTNS